MNLPPSTKPPEDRFYTRTFALITALVLVAALYSIVQPFLGPLLWAIFLAFLLHPLHVRLTRQLKHRSQWSATLLTLLTLLVLVGPLTGLSAAFAAQVGDLLQYMQQTVADQSRNNVLDLTNVPWIRDGLVWLDRSFDINLAQVRGYITEGTRQLLQMLASIGGKVFLGAIGTVVGFVLMMFMLFFFIRDGEEMFEAARELIPLSTAYKAKLFDHLAAVTRALVFGTLITALIQGALVGIAFPITSLPSPVVFAVVAALVSLLPFGGTALVWIPATIALAGQGRLGWAGFMLIWGVLISLVDNFVRPLLVSGRAQIGTLTVFIGVVGGIAAFGAIGLFLGPVIVALIVALVQFTREVRALEAAGGSVLAAGDPNSTANLESSRPQSDPLGKQSSTLRIATRQSRLALWQAEHVAARLRAAHPGLEVVLVPMTTQGDRVLDRALAEIGGKGLFIKELEVAIAEGRADIAVHSMKDVPGELPTGMVLAAMLEREDPHDAFVSRQYASFEALPQGARVGTSSLRRQCQLKALRPDLELLSLRGNVETRLRKLDEGQYDAIVLASAGLIRLGLQARITQSLSFEVSLPAVGQGIIGIECRQDDRRSRELVQVLDNAVARQCCEGERAFSHRLQGSCQSPIAGYALVDAGELLLRGVVGSADGRTVHRASLGGPASRARELGVELADKMLAAGAAELLTQQRGSAA
jgi:hydroxymethylbilane synthase